MPHTEPSNCFGCENEQFSRSAAVSRSPTLVPGHLRSWGFLIGLLCTVVLLIAWHLEPDYLPLGPGSQLSFPGCSFRDRTGYPCPTCGMTTAWSKAVRGQLVTAFRANIAGVVLAVVTLLGALFGLATAVVGRVFYLGVVAPVLDLFSPRRWLYGLLALILLAWAWNALWAFVAQLSFGS
ncbi:MAG: DUF2752 domain-containing protein [Actinobacteria bacterium]|nr:DUF2752 domain-containing protein [Actinomycetota bacterium]